MANRNVPAAWANFKTAEVKEEKPKTGPIKIVVGDDMGGGTTIVTSSKVSAARMQADIDAEYERKKAESEANKKVREEEKKVEKAKKKAEKEAAKEAAKAAKAKK
jgi:hypothetical protein